MGFLLQDTSVTTYIHLPISTNAVRRGRPQDGNLIAICRQSTAIYYILLYSTKFTKPY